MKTDTPSVWTGLVVKNTGSWYTVRTDDGQLVESKIKGNFRLKGIRSTNPVAVGDRVTIVTNQEGTAFISEIEDRRNYIASLLISPSRVISWQRMLIRHSCLSPSAVLRLPLLLLTVSWPRLRLIACLSSYYLIRPTCSMPICAVIRR